MTQSEAQLNSEVQTNSTGIMAGSKEILTAAIAGLNELSAVEQVIRSKLKSDATLLVKIPEYLLALGGKRMRPVLTLLCAKALGMHSVSQSVIDIAAGIELIHMATLLHDDIIDNSPLRRHKESPYLKFGLNSSLLAGDFLLVRAFSLCATLDPAIIKATEIACIHLTEGEILEIPLYQQAQSVTDALTIAEKKTAALFRLAAYSAAFLGKNAAQVITAFSDFGNQLGIAFQILDDILDVTSDADLLGKPSGTDIRERKPALVNILWLASGSALAKNLLTSPGADESDFIEKALAELRLPGNTVISEATNLARKYALAAKQSLEQGLKLSNCSPNNYQAALFALIDYTLERVQ